MANLTELYFAKIDEVLGCGSASALRRGKVPFPPVHLHEVKFLLPSSFRAACNFTGDLEGSAFFYTTGYRASLPLLPFLFYFLPRQTSLPNPHISSTHTTPFRVCACVHTHPYTKFSSLTRIKCMRGRRAKTHDKAKM